ncbi:MAG TPA: transporter substrate-binding domain-containing protein [Pseudomonas sp.]|nr:transporter substrate-binding domain-containing protein [Pseudomonas sp.]
MPARREAGQARQSLHYGLALLVSAAAVCWLWLLPMLDEPDLKGGPLLQAARSNQVLRIGVRSYPRPSYGTEALVAEPDEIDAELAAALGRYLGIEVRLSAIPNDDLPDYLQKGEVDAAIVGSLDVPALDHQRAALSELPRPYRHGALLVLRNESLPAGTELKGQTVCIAFGSPWATTLERQGAELRTFPSNIRAASAFLAGDCRLLADERTVLTSLLQTPEWRFYRMLPNPLEASSDARIYLARPDQRTLRVLQAGLRDWQSRGGQVRAWDLHSNAFLVDSMKVGDGLVCH